MNKIREWNDQERLVSVKADSVTLKGNLVVPKESHGVVLFTDGIGSNQRNSSNRYVTQGLHQAGLATLWIDLLTPDEELIDLRTKHHLRFNIGLLAAQIIAITNWLIQHPIARSLKIGYLGASTGSGAALVAAACLDAVGALVCRGGLPDLAGATLSQVQAPTLLIAGENDIWAIEMGQETLMHLRAEKRMELISGATHPFEEPGALLEVTWLTSQWFKHYLTLSNERDIYLHGESA